MIYVIGVIILAIIFFQIIPRIGNKVHELEETSHERHRKKAEKLGMTPEQLNKRQAINMFVIIGVAMALFILYLAATN